MTLRTSIQTHLNNFKTWSMTDKLEHLHHEKPTGHGMFEDDIRVPSIIEAHADESAVRLHQLLHEQEGDLPVAATPEEIEVEVMVAVRVKVPVHLVNHGDGWQNGVTQDDVERKLSNGMPHAWNHRIQQMQIVKEK